MNIKPFDRLSFQVESESRPGEHHIVDLETMVCSCEDFSFAGFNWCKHIEAVLALSTVANEPVVHQANPLDMFF
jgi:hypothetical protein